MPVVQNGAILQHHLGAPAVEEPTIIRITDVTNPQPTPPTHEPSNNKTNDAVQMEPDVHVDDLHNVLLNGLPTHSNITNTGPQTSGRRLGNYAVRNNNRPQYNITPARSTLRLPIGPPPCSLDAQSDTVLVCEPGGAGCSASRETTNTTTTTLGDCTSVHAQDPSVLKEQSKECSIPTTADVASPCETVSCSEPHVGTAEPVDLGPRVMEGVFPENDYVPVETVGEVTIATNEAGVSQGQEGHHTVAAGETLMQDNRATDLDGGDPANPTRRQRKSKVPTKVAKPYATRSRGNDKENNEAASNDGN